jgi:hypothetical protein
MRSIPLRLVDLLFIPDYRATADVCGLIWHPKLVHGAGTDMAEAGRPSQARTMFLCT